MKRAALERQRAVRIWRQHAALNSSLHSGNPELHPGHFRKGLRVAGCGNAGCRLCHSGKIDGSPTLREWRHNFTYREQIIESAV